MKTLHTFLLAVVIPSLLAGSSRAQALKTAERMEPAWFVSGVHENTSAEPARVCETYLVSTNATSLRVRFAAWFLGQGSFVRLTSLRDGAEQILHQETLALWNGTSAWFNGDAVRLQLFVAAGDRGIFADTRELLTDCGCDTAPAPKAGPASKTLCGSDDRVASGDNRVGRIGGCTGWLVSNGAVLTAGHCAPVTGAFEVNIPPSQANGTVVRSSPQNQYPIDPNGWTWINAGNGNDWAVFRLLPNTANGTRAHVQHGFFRMSRVLPSLLATVRVTGCGIDNSPAGADGTCCNFDNSGNCTHSSCNAQSQTLQTGTGTFQGEFPIGERIELRYRVDTEPANSGSPIIHDANGFAIGIHDAGGCTGNPLTVNVGTSFENAGLRNALENFPGSNTRYADTISPTGSRDGSVFAPYYTVKDAVNAVPSNGIVSVVSGTYTRGDGNTMRITKPLRIIAPVGTARIGL